MAKTKDLEGLKIPRHVAIIMDGNGRWAKAKGLPRNLGHAEGARVVEDILEKADHLGIEYLTVYAFSTENWSRPQNEVDALMKLLRQYMKNCLQKSNKNNVRVRVIGDKCRLLPDLQESIRNVEEGTAGNTGIHFTIAINYGGRDEIRRAVTAIGQKIENGELKSSEITEELINSNLDMGDYPEPDLLIRTCNELRISNFLLWEIAYSEMYFTPVAWPDFNEDELIRAIEAYNGRERRYGGLV